MNFAEKIAIFSVIVASFMTFASGKKDKVCAVSIADGKVTRHGECVDASRRDEIIRELREKVEKNKNGGMTVPGAGENCSVVCEQIANGSAPNNPVGFAISGNVARIYPKFSESSGLEVYCDCTNGSDGAWTVFQRRLDGSVDFNRGWNDYVNGFGNRTGEFWLGLEAIHKFTEDGGFEAKVDLMDFNNNTTYSFDRTFKIDNASTNYTLTASGDAGPTNSELSFNTGNKFSTRDRINTANGINCGKILKGGWWFDEGCGYSNLNGVYYRRETQTNGTYNDAIYWEFWNGFPSYSSFFFLKTTEMKIRSSKRNN